MSLKLRIENGDLYAAIARKDLPYVSVHTNCIDYEAFPCQGREFIFRRVGDNEKFTLISICRNLDMVLSIIDDDWELQAYGKAGRPKDSESETEGED